MCHHFIFFLVHLIDKLIDKRAATGGNESWSISCETKFEISRLMTCLCEKETRLDCRSILCQTKFEVSRPMTCLCKEETRWTAGSVLVRP